MKEISLRAKVVVVALVLLVDTPRACQASIPSFRCLSDMARTRVEAVSFFLMCLAVCLWALKRVWNAFRKDFPGLPLLSTKRAAACIAMVGLVVLLISQIASAVHTMVNVVHLSATDEIRGKIKNPGAMATLEIQRDQARRDRLEALSILLKHYAEQHDGYFPADDKGPEIPAKAWELPDPAGMRYLYIIGQTTEGANRPLAYEPGIFGKERFVLMTDGVIQVMSVDQIEASLPKEETP